MKKILNISNPQKITILVFGLIFIAFISTVLPSMARMKNRVVVENIVWDGSVASSFKRGSGLENDPFIISTPQEFAYLATNLRSTTYKDTYFKLTNNMHLNQGSFDYNNNTLTYVKEDSTYYVKEGQYFETSTYENYIGSLNIFESLNNFEGHFDGNYYTVFGFYDYDDNAGLFTNLRGTVENLYVENSAVIGHEFAGGIATNASNATIKNVMFKGVVDAKDEEKTSSELVTIGNITTSLNETITNISLNKVPTGSKNVEYVLKGNYAFVNGSNGSVYINNNLLENGAFTLTLNDVSNLEIKSVSEVEDILEFSNVILEKKYTYSSSGGIVSNIENSTIENAINKGSISGNYASAGIVGIMNNSNIYNSYNTGVVNGEGDISSISAILYGTDNIDRVYNLTTTLTLLSVLNDATINLSNSFMIGNIEAINEKNNSTFNVENSYSSSDKSSKYGFVKKNIEDFKNKEFLETIFSKYISLDDVKNNKNNVWLYNESYPLLFIDDLDNRYVTLTVNGYVYKNFTVDTNNIKVNDSIVFTIDKNNELDELSIYYIIDNNKQTLTDLELEQKVNWTTYSDKVTLTEDDRYTIYVKVVDSSNNVSYLNSDVFLLGDSLSKTNVSIKINNNVYSSFKTEVDKLFINEDAKYTIEYKNDYYDIDFVGYYLSNKVQTEEELEKLEFSEYDETKTINKVGKYIVYAKVEDVYGNTTYVNTDFIVYDGFTSSLTVGRNTEVDDSINISDKSYLKYNFVYMNDYDSMINGTHKLISNIILPLGTEITLFDNLTKKVYEYNITDSNEDYGYNESCLTEGCKKFASYSFTSFYEKGKSSKVYYEETNDLLYEDFTIKVDFKDTTILEDFNNVNISLSKVNKSKSINTLKKTIDKVNIIHDNELELSFDLTLPNEEIIHNSNSVTEVDFVSGITYKTKDDKDIVDISNEDKKQSLIIKLVDSNGTQLSNDYLKNIVFSVGDNVGKINFYNEIIVNVSDTLDTVNKKLKIKTFNSNLILNEGTYYFEVTNFISYDGVLIEKKNTNSFKIPFIVSNTNYVKTGYVFDVQMNNDVRLINRKNESSLINFNVTMSENIDKPKVTISLYKKDSLSGYEQYYSIVDLNNYVMEELTTTTPNVYDVTLVDNQFNLTLNMDEFENTGYMFVYELYDKNNKKIGSMSEKFIVR